jgi:hypothetical protein
MTTEAIQVPIERMIDLSLTAPPPPLSLLLLSSSPETLPTPRTPSGAVLHRSAVPLPSLLNSFVPCWLPQIEGEAAKGEYRSSQERLGRDILQYVARNAEHFRVERGLVGAHNLEEEISLFSALDSPTLDPLDTRGVAVSEVSSPIVPLF